MEELVRRQNFQMRGLDYTFQVDLVEMHSDAQVNESYVYILILVVPYIFRVHLCCSR